MEKLPYLTHLGISVVCIVIATWRLVASGWLWSLRWWALSLLASGLVFVPRWFEGIHPNEAVRQLIEVNISSGANLFVVFLIVRMYQTGPVPGIFLRRFLPEAIAFLLVPIALLIVHLIHLKDADPFLATAVVSASQLAVALMSFILLWVLSSVLERRVFTVASSRDRPHCPDSCCTADGITCSP